MGANMTDFNFTMVEYAKYFAIGAHGQQKRKYTGQPYWIHLESVYRILVDNYKHIDAYICAWLHDVVEDTNFSIFDIQLFFGHEIARYVSDLTEPQAPGKNRAWRKDHYNEQLKNSSPLVQTVKYADLIDNTGSIEKHDPDFAKVYLAEKRILLPLINKGDPTLYSKVCSQVGL